MPHANIWIRKANASAWEAKGDKKSEWVNTKLEQEASTTDAFSRLINKSPSED